jgi:hypothetical protein
MLHHLTVNLLHYLSHSPQGKPIMAYTLKRSLNGLTLDDIKRIYDNNPNMTLRELSSLTGLAVPFLKKLLLGGN